MARRQLSGKRAIITGASSGIGRHLAIQLATAGVKLVVTARREDRLRELQKRIRDGEGDCEVVVGDVVEPGVRTRLLETAKNQFGGLDILINNAGIGAMGRFDQATPERLQQIFNVNFFAAAELIRDAVPTLRDGDRPIIVNISSVLGHRGVPLKSEYCASKFALHGFSDSIRAELVADGIDVLLVSPSTTDSDFFDASIEDTTGEDWKKRGAMSPEVVAAKTVKAIRKGRHEIILTHGGRLLVWADRILPGVANRLLAWSQK